MTLCFNGRMSSAENPRESLADLNDVEKRLLAQLVRIMVRSDGSFSNSEKNHLEGLSQEMGGDDFFKIVEEVSQLDESSELILKKAVDIGDKDSHELIYGALYELSIVDGSDGSENQILDTLAAGWKLEISNVTES